MLFLMAKHIDGHKNIIKQISVNAIRYSRARFL